MRCPECGHENSNVVTRCSVCGSPLPSANLVRERDTERRPIIIDEDTKPRPAIPLEELDENRGEMGPEFEDELRGGLASDLEDEFEDDLYDFDEDFGEDAEDYGESFAEGARGHGENAGRYGEGFADGARGHGENAGRYGEDFAEDGPHNYGEGFVEGAEDYDEDFDNGALVPVAASSGGEASGEPVRPRRERRPRREHKVAKFFAAHDRALGIGLAVIVVAILGVAWYLFVYNDKPTNEHIADELAAQMGSYKYEGGTYGPDLEVPLKDVTIVESEATRASGEAGAADGGSASAAATAASTAYAVKADAKFENEAMQVTRHVGATFAQADGGWHAAGEMTDLGTTLFVKQGVDEGKLLANMDSVLSAASGGERVSLSDIYRDGQFSVESNVFAPGAEVAGAEGSEATDVVVVHCSKESGFYQYQGNVTAHFVFKDGVWALDGAEHDEQATARSYDRLVGTWTGSMVSQESADGDCFGAQDYPLVVKIESLDTNADAGGLAGIGEGKVQGTVSLLAHCHGRLTSNATRSEGDMYLEDVPFVGVISSERSNDTGSSLNVECTVDLPSSASKTSENADADATDGTGQNGADPYGWGQPGANENDPYGTGQSRTGTSGNSGDKGQNSVSMVLGFGTDDDPSAVIARVVCEHSYEDPVLWIIPHTTTSRFTDTYLLSRE